MKILIFIGLKIAEISGFCLILYLLALLGKVVEHYIPPREGWLRLKTLYGFSYAALIGATVFLCLFILASLMAGIIFLVQANWEWADRLVR